MKHILLQKALKYKKRQKIEAPEGFNYDGLLGAWINRLDYSLLIRSLDFPALGSKKEDIETGEDQKGE